MTQVFYCRAAECPGFQLEVNPVNPDETSTELAAHITEQHTSGDTTATAQLMTHPYWRNK